MHVGKSIKIAMAKKQMRSAELAQALGVTASTVSVMSSRTTCTGQMLILLATFFGMKVSEFVALGED